MYYLNLGHIIVVMEAFLAKKNVYFDYEFMPIQLNNHFPDEIYQSQIGEMFKHVVEYPDVTYCIYYQEKLGGDELQKFKDDWDEYCPSS